MLYNTVLVLPYIDMNLPRVYVSSRSWTPLPAPTPYHLSGSSLCTSPKHPVSCIKHRLAIHFLHDSIHVSMPFSHQMILKSIEQLIKFKRERGDYRQNDQYEQKYRGEKLECVRLPQNLMLASSSGIKGWRNWLWTDQEWSDQIWFPGRLLHLTDNRIKVVIIFQLIYFGGCGKNRLRKDKKKKQREQLDLY